MIVRKPVFWLPVLVVVAIVSYATSRQGRWTPTATDSSPDSKIVLEAVKEQPKTVPTMIDSSRLTSESDKYGAISNRTLGFEKIFAINLPWRTDKRDGLLLASKLTGFDIEFMHGVDPASILDKALPVKLTSGKPLKGGILGCWRAHMNFLARVVQDDLASALVMEDDVDWDVRLLTQLKNFAIMSNAVVNAPRGGLQRLQYKDIIKNDEGRLLMHSPYGDGWDVLLLGNCGVDVDQSRTHAIHARDPTVAELQHLKIYGDPNGLRLNPHPNHARLVGYAKDQTCTYAYAVTQTAARRLLYDLGLKGINAPIDYMLREWCEEKDGPPRRCIGVLPSLFESYRREGSGDADSDIDGDKNRVGYRETSYTPNLRKSVRMNLGKLLDGVLETELGDQYPDHQFGAMLKKAGDESTDPHTHNN